MFIIVEQIKTKKTNKNLFMCTMFGKQLNIFSHTAGLICTQLYQKHFYG